MLNILLVAFMLYMSWIIWKIADWHVDNWINFWKKYTYLWDISRALLWILAFFFSHNLYIVLVSVILYWVYKIKFDFTNHALTLITFIIWIIYYNNLNHDLIVNYWFEKTILYILLLLFIYIILSYLKKYNKAFCFTLSLFIPAIFWIFTKDIYAGLSIFFFLWWVSSMYVFKMKQKSFFKN